MSIEREFVETVIRRLKYYKELGDRSFDQLEEKDFHFQPNEASNSIAIVIQHLAGNMLSRWTDFLHSDGEKEWRNREEEFAVLAISREQLLERWEKGWNCFLTALGSLQGEDLLKTVTIRGEGLTVIDAINRQLAHYPYHVGQIVYISRMIRNQDWQSLSIPRGASDAYNQSSGVKDPAKKF